jgi:hypothetical protein
MNKPTTSVQDIHSERAAGSQRLSNQSPSKTPVCFIIFNRPELTARSFECIRAYKPEVLYVVADAPRKDRPGEGDLTEQARQMTESIDWSCDVTRIYAQTNMGCANRISSGISTILDSFETAIILEDDCLPHPTFFSFCDSMLDHYRDDHRVMAVSGDNFQCGIPRGDASYYFSKYPHCWGWATWRRAWNHFNLQIKQFRDSNGLKSICRTDRELDYWTEIFDRVHAGKIDTWDYSWTLACWMQSGLTALPNQNLISNIGFGNDATHTKSKQSYAELPTFALNEVRHPAFLFRDAVADEFTDNLMFSGKKKKKKSMLRRILPMRRSA